MAAGPTGTPSARLLIVIYGAALVLIGLPALKAEFGGVDGFFSYLKRKTAVMAIAPDGHDGITGSERKIEVDTKAVTPAAANKKADAPLDRIREKDRAELDDLVNKLD